MHGILILNKKENETSFESLRPIKRFLQRNCIGHAGTLDKFASGILVVLIGKYTKLSNYISNFNKEYISEFEFGLETDTLDPNGIIINRTSLIPTLDHIKKVLKNNFFGEIYQVPPKFSSIHVNGKRAYKLALKGEDFSLKKRKINIFSIEVLNYNSETHLLKLKIYCSKGTYIRSIARDLAYLLNSLAYVKSLKRTKVGKFKLEDSISSENFNKNSLIYIDSLDFRVVYIDENKVFLVKKGVYIDVEIYLGEMVVLKGVDNKIVAFIKGIGIDIYKYIIIF